jgi:histidine triad (HIT) family protein
MRGTTRSEPRCIFCGIVERRVPADEVLRDEHIVAFRDIKPVAPTHILVVPTTHAVHLSEFAKLAGAAASARLLAAAAELGARFGERGYRVVTNEGVDAGQSVYHLHLHVLAGRKFRWPPG